jgi:hypothetical protein
LKERLYRARAPHINRERAPLQRESKEFDEGVFIIGRS